MPSSPIPIPTKTTKSFSVEENIRPTRPSDLERGPLAIFGKFIRHLQGTQKRSPPSPDKKRHVRLITIGASHYSEKARWALDLAEHDVASDVYYTEDAHPPALASFISVPITSGRSSSLPITVEEENVVGKDDSEEVREKMVLMDSTDIIKHYCPYLYDPEHDRGNEIEKFEEYLDSMLGPAVRVFVYHHMLNKQYFPSLIKMLSAHTSLIESLIFSLTLERGIDRGMRKLMNVNEETAELSESQIRDVFEKVSLRLTKSSGNNYLFQNRYGAENKRSTGFSAADLTFAALSSPIVMPKELKKIYNLSDNELPGPILALQRELRNTPAGKHAMQMYKRHRLVDYVIPKSVGRNHLSGNVKTGLFGIATVCAASALVTSSKL